jgi:hypothetical protein
MPIQIMKRALLLVMCLVGLTFAGTAEASVPCSVQSCVTTLHARSTVRHWAVEGEVGEKWLLYLNVYVNGERLDYSRLPGGCEASYDGQGATVLLHACGNRAHVDYVALGAPRTLRVEYRYERR